MLLMTKKKTKQTKKLTKEAADKVLQNPQWQLLGQERGGKVNREEKEN